MLQDYHYIYVEDDDMSRQIMQLVMDSIIMTDHYFIFEDSKNFVERVQALSFTPDIFLLDIRVDPHDGFELLKMIRSNSKWKNIPVVALTASVMKDQLKQLKEAGFSSAIGKPLDIDSFPSKLEQILSGEKVWSVS